MRGGRGIVNILPGSLPFNNLARPGAAYSQHFARHGFQLLRQASIPPVYQAWFPITSPGKYPSNYQASIPSNYQAPLSTLASPGFP